MLLKFFSKFYLFFLNVLKNFDTAEDQHDTAEKLNVSHGWQLIY